MVKIFIPLMLLLIVHESAAQMNAKTDADTLVGLVVSQKGKAMKNIQVSLPGKEVQPTDKKGIFVFPNVSLSDTLTVVIPKSRTWRIPVSGISFLKITIHDDHFSMTEAKNEIIRTGYGVEKKRTNTSGHTVISGDELRRGAQSDLTQALAAKVFELTIVRMDTGEEKLSFRNRTPSIHVKDYTPLYVVDDAIVNNLDHVDILTVESVTVMKYASIYGSRGGNGAIVVKTNNIKK